MSKSRTYLWIKVFLFVAGTVWFAYLITTRSAWIVSKPYPTSTDGFYYLQEFRERIETGNPYYEPHSPFFWIGGIIGRAFNLNEIQLFNVTVIGGLLLLYVAIAVAFANKRDWWLVPALGGILWTSDILFFRHYAFTRQALAAALAIAGILTWEGSSDFTRSKKRLARIASLVLLLLGSQFHLFGTLLVCVWVGTIAFFRAHKFGKLALSAIGIVGIIAAPFILKRPVFHWDTTKSLGFIEACTFAKCSPFEWREFSLYGIYALLFSSYLIAYRKNILRTVSWFGLFYLLNLPIFELHEHMAYRLALASAWVFFLGLGTVVIWTIDAGDKVRGPLIASFVLLFCLESFTKQRREYISPTIPPAFLEQNREELLAWLPEDAIVLAPHGVQFEVTYFLRRKGMKDPPIDLLDVPYFDISNNAREAARCRNELALYDGKVSKNNTNTRSCFVLGDNWVMRRLLLPSELIEQGSK